MSNELPTLRNIAREILKKGYVKRAKRRAIQRKSPWNFVVVLLGWCFFFLTTYALFQLMWKIHIIIYPFHINKLGEFWGKGIGASSFASSFLLLIPLLFASFPISMLLANAVVWLIPPARRAFDSEAKGVKWASFRESMSGLLAIAKIMVPVCLLLSFTGAATLANLR